jgi:lipopolysaccharide/colanic/teichoic acid biosynthesis glycosyltransferase
MLKKYSQLFLSALIISDLEKRIEHDLYYIKQWSWFFDIKTLIRTLWNGFVNRHAY